MGQTDKHCVVHSPASQSYSTNDKRYNERVYATQKFAVNIIMEDSGTFLTEHVTKKTFFSADVF